MKFFKHIALLAVILGVVLMPAAKSSAQVAVGVGVGGPGYQAQVAYGQPQVAYGDPEMAYAQPDMAYGYPPQCPYGYYNYAPYACAPYGYYGPGWFTGGLFIGRWLNHHMRGDAFLRYVHGLVVAVGLMLLIQALRHR